MPLCALSRPGGLVWGLWSASFSAPPAAKLQSGVGLVPGGSAVSQEVVLEPELCLWGVFPGVGSAPSVVLVPSFPPVSPITAVTLGTCLPLVGSVLPASSSGSDSIVPTFAIV